MLGWLRLFKHSMAILAAGDTSASQNAQELLSIWQLRRRRQHAARARDKAAAAPQAPSPPPGLTSPRTNGSARRPVSESSFPAPCGAKIVREELSGITRQERLPPGVWWPETSKSTSDSAADRLFSTSGEAAIERRLDGVVTALRLFAKNVPFSGNAVVSTSVGDARRNSLLEDVHVVQERMVARFRGLETKLDEKLELLAERFEKRATDPSPLLHAIEHTGGALTEHLAEVMQESVMQVMTRLDALLFKSDSVLARLGSDAAFSDRWRQAATSTRSGQTSSCRASSRDSLSSAGGSAARGTDRKLYERYLSDDEEPDKHPAGGRPCAEVAHLWRATPLVVHRCDSCANSASFKCSSCHCIRCSSCIPAGLQPAPAPPPPDEPPRDEWWPAALGLVAPGSRVHVLGGAENGRAGTVLTVGPTTGLADGCNVRLDGAKGNTTGWCLAKTLADVAPQSGNLRIKLPMPLQSFQPDRKGPRRDTVFFSAEEIALQLGERLDFASPRPEALLELHDRRRASGKKSNEGHQDKEVVPTPPRNWRCSACSAGPEDLEWLFAKGSPCCRCRKLQTRAWNCGGCDGLFCARCINGGSSPARSGGAPRAVDKKGKCR